MSLTRRYLPVFPLAIPIICDFGIFYSPCRKCFVDKSIHSREYGRFLALLKRARTDAKMTQVELGERLGEDQPFVSTYERGERPVDVVELRHTCDAPGVPFHDFVSELYPPD
jgi:hypothetical protein